MLRWITRSAWVVIMLAFVAGCAYYPISKKYREEAIRGTGFSSVQQDPQKYKGSVVIWGGSILKNSTDSAGGTKLTVLQMPLDNQEYPVRPVLTNGRFVAISSAFLEPELYRKGRRVTMAGRLTGSQALPLDGGQYTYPVINIDQIKLWPRNVTNYYSPYYYGPGFSDPYYWPYDGYYWDGGDFGNDFFGDDGDFSGGFDNGDEGEGGDEGGGGDEGDGGEGQ